MRRSRRALLAQAKVARQKKIVVVGSVVLAGLLAFQAPRTLKLLHGSSAPPPPTPSGTATPATGSGPPAPPPPPSATLPETDRVSVKPDAGQLVSFGLFKAKDPFVPQIPSSSSGSGTAGSPSSAPPSTTSSSSSSPLLSPPPSATPTSTTSDSPPTRPPTATLPPPTAPTPTLAPQPPPVSTPPATPPASPPLPAPAAASVAISTNGTCESVPLEGAFPSAEKLFRVAAIAKDGSSAEIAIVGGSYENGRSTVTLAAGLPLTFVNTADGVMYDLELVSSCGALTSTSPTTTVPAPTSTVPTSTTP